MSQSRDLHCTAYCSCGHCCNWEWGLTILGTPFYIGLGESTSPQPPLPPKLSLKTRRKPVTENMWLQPPLNRFWTAPGLAGAVYKGTTATGTMPQQAKQSAFPALTASLESNPIGQILSKALGARVGTIAADTSVFPFGTKIHVPGYGWGKVEDRGGAIKGNEHVDLFHDNHKDALQWGVRDVKALVVFPSKKN